MKKSRKAIAFAVLAVGLTFSAIITQVSITQATQASTQETIQPDKATIDKKIHSNKLKSFNYDMKLTEAYLSQLNAKELLEVVAEYSTEDDNTFNDSIGMISPHLKNKMKGGIYTQQLDEILKDKTNNKKYRVFLIDLYSNLKSPDQNDFVSETLLTLATDKSENEDIRSYALGELKQESKDKVKKDKQDKALRDHFYDATTPDKVKANILTAMRRTNNPYLYEAITSVLDKYEQKDPLLVRHALVSGAKSGMYKDTNKIKFIAKNTLNSEVYASSVYALSLLRNEEALKAVIEVYGKHNNNDIGYFALISNQKLILNMLDNNQSKENLLDAIKASELINLHAALDKLQEIANSNSDSEVRSKANDAFNKINNIPRSAFPSNADKWEDEWSMKKFFGKMMALSILAMSFVSITAGSVFANSEAMYRSGSMGNYLDHAGVRKAGVGIYEIKGYFHTVDLNTWSSWLGSNEYLGSFINPLMTSTDKTYVQSTLSAMEADTDIDYTGLNMIDWDLNPGSDIDPWEIDDIRCDGVVEYAYEWHNIWVWEDQILELVRVHLPILTSQICHTLVSTRI